MRNATTLYEVKSNLALVYKKASFASDIVGKLPKGAQIEVLRFTNQWVCFIFNGTEAYIRKSSIKISTTTTTTTGSVTIKYLNVDDNSEITTSDIHNNLQLGTYTYKAKTISNYAANLPTSQSVTLDENNPNQTITFYYSQILGDITVKYIDFDNDNEISTSDIYSNLPLGTYTYEAKDISNYTAISPTSQSVTLDENNSTQTITFYYSKILGNVTVKYIDIDNNNNEIATSDIYSNLPLGTYTYEAKVIDNYTVILPDLQSVTLTEAYPDQTITFNYKLNQNEVPYISTYYIKPIVSPDEEVIIDYYITDYYHKEYVNEDYSEIFTVTVRIEGKDDLIIENLQAGDHSVSLGTFPNLDGQEQKFSILCTDKCGRNSHELFNFFLVRNDVPVNEYITTEEDLTTYGISNTNDTTMTTSTREGLQKLLDDKQAAGYNRLKLLEGTYRIDHLGTIYIPTMFTLDMNGATLKLHEFAGDKALMMELNNTFDSHVINGTIEGDYYNHDYTNSPNNSEWVTGISISGNSIYCSYENMIVKDITGYGGSNGLGEARDNSSNFTYLQTKAIGDTFKLGDINRNTGESIESTSRTTCDFIDISGYIDIGYICVSIYLGYQGNTCGTWNLIYHFYDENKKFIRSIDGYQYRIVGIPTNTKFMKVTILNESYPNNLHYHLFKIPTHCSFKNIKFDNCRAVGLAQSAMKDMLVEDCEFTNSGQTLAKCAYDAEDGWDLMQDVTCKHLNFHDNPANDFLTCAGHNFIIEDFVDGKLHIWPRTNSYVVKNNYNLKNIYLGHGNRFKTGYIRFFNNTILANISIGSNSTDNWIVVIKDCEINARTESTSELDVFLRCSLGSGSNTTDNYSNGLGFAFYIDCNIKYKNSQYHSGGNYLNCNIENISGFFKEKYYFENCYINNLNIAIVSDNNEYKFKNCSINNSLISLGNWIKGAHILIQDCNINNNDYLLKIPHYAMGKPIILSNNNFISSGTYGLVYFYDDRINGSISQQDKLVLQENNITLPNSKYIINGLSDTTVNNINIYTEKNIYNPSTLLLCNPLARNCINITITEKLNKT